MGERSSLIPDSGEMNRIAAVITYHDLKVYFQGDRNDDPKDPDVWKSRVEGDEFQADTKRVSFRAVPENVQYKVHIQAREDSSDSKTGVTTEPAKFIADFLSTGGAGDEFFSKRSSTPDEMSETLRWLSDGIIENDIGPVKTAHFLRRIIVKTAKIEMPAANSYDVQMEHIDDLKAKLQDKGWQVSSDTDHNGLPKLHVEVGDEYEATINVDSIKWKTSVTLRSESGETLEPESIVTEDPISSYKKLRRSDQARDFLDSHSKTMHAPGTEDTEFPAPAAPESGPRRLNDTTPDESQTVAPKKKQ